MKKHSIKNKAIVFISVLLSVLILFISGCSVETPSNKGNDTQKAGNNNISEETEKSSTSGIRVHFIDVGQADSILVLQGNSTMLIDAGNNEDSDLVVRYLKENGVKKIDYLVGTHPHEDHIGGLDKVIEEFDIGKIYMPKTKTTSITKTNEDVLDAIKSKGLKISSPNPGTEFKIGDASCMILAPNSKEYDDLNEYSIVIKVVYKDTSFMLTGDASSKSEKEMMAKGFDLSADVLKLGHHGSKSSSSKTFLDKVNPKYAVISVGKDNDYNHPNKTTMNKLQSRGIKVYRTDESGTIICTSDGKTIKFNVKAGSYSYRDK